MKQSVEDWRDSMEDCDQTNEYFESLVDQVADFLDTDNWSDVVKQNYEENKAYVDNQWAQCLKTWNEGVYFNSGMFYARTYMVLSAAQF